MTLHGSQTNVDREQTIVITVLHRPHFKSGTIKDCRGVRIYSFSRAGFSQERVLESSSSCQENVLEGFYSSEKVKRMYLQNLGRNGESQETHMV